MRNNIFGYIFILFIIVILGFAIYRVKIQEKDEKNEEQSQNQSVKDIQKGREMTLAISEFDTINPINIGRKFASIAEPMSFNLKTNAPNIAGIDNIKLNLAANSFSRPAVKPAAIVVPDLESPGRIAQA